MNIRIEGGKLVTPEGKAGKQTREYYSFWVHVFSGARSITISGWKFFPDQQTVSTPSVSKGPGRFVNTSRVSKEFYNQVSEEAQKYFAASEEVSEEEESHASSIVD